MAPGLRHYADVFYIAGQDNQSEHAVTYGQCCLTASTLTGGDHSEKRGRTFIVTTNFTTTDQATIKLQQRSCSARGDSNQAYGNIVQDNYRDKGLRAVTARPAQQSTTTRCHNNSRRTCIWRYRGELAVGQLSKITSRTTTAALPTLPDSHGVSNAHICQQSLHEHRNWFAHNPAIRFCRSGESRSRCFRSGSPDRGAGTPYIDVNISWPFVPDIGAMLDVSHSCLNTRGRCDVAHPGASADPDSEE